MARLRIAQLEEQLPPFHEIRLVELQVVAMQSPLKAVMELQRLLSSGNELLAWDSHKEQRVDAVTWAFDEMQELPRDVGEQLLHHLRDDKISLRVCCNF